MAFAFRVDIDSRYGLRYGVPNLLDMLRKTDIPAAFVVVMGGESGVVDLLRFRGGKSGLAGGSSIPKSDMARMLLRPKNFAEENAELLERVMSEGHTLGVHAWKHRPWTRALEHIDVKKHMKMATDEYVHLFGKKPHHFVSPGFFVNGTVLEGLDELGYRFASDLPGERPFRPVWKGRKFRHVQVPITLKARDTSPLFEYYCRQGVPDELVADKVLGQVVERERKGKWSTVYAHDVFEGTFKPHVVERFLRGIKKEGIEVTTFEKLARKGKTRFQKVSFE